MMLPETEPPKSQDPSDTFMGHMPKTVYATLSGTVDGQMVQRVFAGFANAVNARVEVVHLYFHSLGGSVADGMAIYHFLKGLPIQLVMHNGGSVASIGVIVYLAAHIRKASASAIFMIHKSSLTPNAGTTVTQLQNLAQNLNLEDERTEGILRQHLHMPDDIWERHRYENVTFNATDSAKIGLVHEVSDFCVPPGSQLYNV